MIKRLVIINNAWGNAVRLLYGAYGLLIGPATSGFTTASIYQSGISTGRKLFGKKKHG